MAIDKHPITAFEHGYLSQFPEVTLDAVGPYVGAGAQHVVRAYTQCDLDEKGTERTLDKVIKYPRARTWRDVFSLLVSPSVTPSVKQMERDVKLADTYLAPFVVAPDVLADPTGEHYALIQDRLGIADLTRKAVREDIGLRQELQELIECNRRLLADEKLFFDFMGWNWEKITEMKPYLDNVSLRTQPAERRLAILDCTLYEAPNLSMKGIHHWFLQNVQRMNLRGYGMRM